MKERWISARRAAEFLGYEPGDGPSHRDPAMRAFYEFVRRHRHRIVTKKVGRLLRFRESSLEAAIDAFTTEADRKRSRSRFEEMQQRAREHARGVTSA